MASKKQRTLFAASICVLSCLCISIMGVFSKLVSHETSAFTILLSLCVVIFLGTTAQILKQGVSTLRTNRLGLHCVRGITGVVAYAFLFMALKTTPLVDSMLLNNTAPIWVPFIAFLWLKVRMRKEIWLTVGVGFLGVIAILKPDSGIFLTGSFFALLSGIFTAISFLSVARLKCTESTTCILFYFSLIGIITTLPLGVHIPSQRDFWLLLGVGLIGFSASALLAYSFEHGKASALAPLIYTTVVFSGIFDWLIWHHIPDFVTFLGMILVIGGSILSIHFEESYQKKLENANP
ncbi:MAG: DMT family transporter [Simkania sp.]|nr:DMT family transporter [Simkania sp.]